MEVRGAKVFDEEIVSQAPDIAMRQFNPVSIYSVLVNPILPNGLARILELLDSNLGRDTGYVKNFRGFPQFPQRICQNITLY
jgi:hypothetical protein